MFTANESQTYQQFSAQHPSYLDHMAFSQLEKNYNLPFFPKRTPDVAFRGQSASNLPCLNTGLQDAVSGFLKPVPPFCNISNQNGSLYPNALSHGLGFTDTPPQKKFLIFDQSGDHTRLFFGPSLSPQGPVLASKTPSGANGLSGLVGSGVDQRLLMKPIGEEKWDENHLTDGEDEMLEDSDEIDALLYSDSNDDDDDAYDDNNDEVTSTRQSPFISTEEGCTKNTSLDDEVREQVASSDENNSPKRQRLLDGKYKKPSLDWAESPMKQASTSCHENDVESSCAGYRNPSDDIESNKRENKVKIRQALRILETIIPGLDSKDPISIIDRAVSYLESMKTEADALGLGYLVP